MRYKFPRFARNVLRKLLPCSLPTRIFSQMFVFHFFFFFANAVNAIFPWRGENKIKVASLSIYPRYTCGRKSFSDIFLSARRRVTVISTFSLSPRNSGTTGVRNIYFMPFFHRHCLCVVYEYIYVYIRIHMHFVLFTQTRYIRLFLVESNDTTTGCKKKNERGKRTEANVLYTDTLCERRIDENGIRRKGPKVRN